MRSVSCICLELCLWLRVVHGHHIIKMKSEYPDVTEQDASLSWLTPASEESLAEFVMELWAQHRRVTKARRIIQKQWVDEVSD